jgi:prokaryotic ubiquitin-like protein Pup
MAQEQKHPKRNSDKVDTTEDAATTSESKGALDQDVDDILAEIDEVLEVNAEDFVKSFVQKGGQ